MTHTGEYSQRVIPSPLHVVTYPARAFLAAVLGYFWLPCPLCGRKFAGFQWKRVRGQPCSIPVEGTYWRGQGICPTCTRMGLGYDQWPEWAFHYRGGTDGA
jgi:hypothetical protein